MDQSLNQFYVYGLTALLACTMKIVILSLAVSKSKLTAAFYLVCLALIAQNALEFLSAFIFGANPSIADYFVDGVMFSLYILAAALIFFCATVAQVRRSRLIVGFYAGFAALVGVLHLSGSLVTGYEASGYTLISIEGPLYPVFQIYILSVITGLVTILVRGMMSPAPEVQARCRTTLLGIAPICAVGLGVVIFRLMGFNSSAAIIMPLASTFFVWILMLDQRGEFITFQVKWRIIWKLATNIKNLNMAEWAEEVEKQLVLEAMRTERNNKSAAARLLGSNQTTFHRKAEKYLAIPARRNRPRRHPAIAADYDFDLDA